MHSRLFNRVARFAVAIAVVAAFCLPATAAARPEPGARRQRSGFSLFAEVFTIFLVNMELGFITPPVGMNLFLASFRFRRPLGEIYRASIPFLIVMAIGVLLITYMPALTIGVVRLLGK